MIKLAVHVGARHLLTHQIYKLNIRNVVFFVCVYIHQHRRYAHKSYRLRDDRRKFRSQTSDNMERWKSRGRKSQRREEKKEDQIRERVRGKEIEKVVRSQNTLFFQLFVAPKGRKVGSLKRRVRSHLGR